MLVIALGAGAAIALLFLASTVPSSSDTGQCFIALGIVLAALTLALLFYAECTSGKFSAIQCVNAATFGFPGPRVS